jgi:hypothetical protein
VNQIVSEIDSLLEASGPIPAVCRPRPRGRHTSAGETVGADAREIVRRHLQTRGRSCGPAVLAARVRSIAAARDSDDPEALRGALIDLAAAALSWADLVDPRSERPRLEAVA